MDIKSKILIVIFSIIFLFPKLSFAQNKIIERIKIKMVDLAQKNYELKKELDTGMQDVYALQKKVDEEKSALKVVEDGYNKKIKRIEKRKDHIKYLYKKMDIVQSDILIKKSRVAFLKKQLLEKQETYDLLSLRLADLKTRKKNLQMKLNGESFSSAKMEKEISNKLVSLKMQLNSNISKQKNLSQLIIELEENNFSYSQKIQEIAKENKRLEGLVEEFKRKKDLKDRENLILKDKLTLSRTTLEGDIKIRTGERDNIKEEVERLETEYSDLTQKIKEALRWKAKKVKYQQEMVALDKENIELRDKIIESRKELDFLKK